MKKSEIVQHLKEDIFVYSMIMIYVGVLIATPFILSHN